MFDKLFDNLMLGLYLYSSIIIKPDGESVTERREMTNLVFNETLKEFEHTLTKLEILERRYGKFISDGLVFEDGENLNTYDLKWYEQYNLFWNVKKDCLYAKIKGYEFPLKECICESDKICHVSMFTFYLEVLEVKEMYTKILKEYINIFNKRIDIITP